MGSDPPNSAFTVVNKIYAPGTYAQIPGVLSDLPWANESAQIPKYFNPSEGDFGQIAFRTYSRPCRHKNTIHIYYIEARDNSQIVHFLITSLALILPNDGLRRADPQEGFCQGLAPLGGPGFAGSKMSRDSTSKSHNERIKVFGFGGPPSPLES